MTGNPKTMTVPFIVDQMINGKYFRSQAIAILQQAVDQARKEAITEALKGKSLADDVAWYSAVKQGKEVGFKEGFEQAREMAAKTIENTAYKTQCQGRPLYTSDELAQFIRALQPPREGAE